MKSAYGEKVEVETGLILPVPQMEAFIRRHRAVNEAVSPEGVPAHLTLLYPFLDPRTCEGQTKDVAEFFAEREPFEFELDHIGWFDERVVFLAPADPSPFIDLTRDLLGAWSECVPYGGRHGRDPVPHLTLGIEGSPGEMASLEAAAREMLPVRCRAEQAWLMVGEGASARWRIDHIYRFGASGRRLLGRTVPDAQASTDEP